MASRYQTFHNSDISELAVSPSSSTKLMMRNLSLDRPPNWKPGNSVTVTVSLAPGFKHPVLGLTLNFSGEVVFTYFARGQGLNQWWRGS